LAHQLWNFFPKHPFEVALNGPQREHGDQALGQVRRPPKGQGGRQARGAAAPKGSGSPGPDLRLASVPEGGLKPRPSPGRPPPPGRGRPGWGDRGDYSPGTPHRQEPRAAGPKAAKGPDQHKNRISMPPATMTIAFCSGMSFYFFAMGSRARALLRALANSPDARIPSRVERVGQKKET